MESQHRLIKRFCDTWDLDKDIVQQVRNLPRDVCTEVIATFDPPSGTRNVNARLRSFLRSKLGGNMIQLADSAGTRSESRFWNRSEQLAVGYGRHYVAGDDYEEEEDDTWYDEGADDWWHHWNSKWDMRAGSKTGSKGGGGGGIRRGMSDRRDWDYDNHDDWGEYRWDGDDGSGGYKGTSHGKGYSGKGGGMSLAIGSNPLDGNLQQRRWGKAGEALTPSSMEPDPEEAAHRLPESLYEEVLYPTGRRSQQRDRDARRPPQSYDGQSMERPQLRNRMAQQQQQGRRGRGNGGNALGAFTGDAYLPVGAIGAPIGAGGTGDGLPASGGGRPPPRKAPPGLAGRGSGRGGLGAGKRYGMESSLASLPNGPSLGAAVGS